MFACGGPDPSGAIVAPPRVIPSFESSVGAVSRTSLPSVNELSVVNLTVNEAFSLLLLSWTDSRPSSPR